jgi:hypothetical protein
MKSTFIIIPVHRNHIKWSLLWKLHPEQSPFNMDNLHDVSWCSRCPISLAARARLAPFGFEGSILAAGGQLTLTSRNSYGNWISHISVRNPRAAKFMDIVDNYPYTRPYATSFMFEFPGDLSHLFPLSPSNRNISTVDPTISSVRL